MPLHACDRAASDHSAGCGGHLRRRAGVLANRVTAPILAATLALLYGAAPARADNGGRLITHQSYVEEVTQATGLPIGNHQEMFAFVLNSLPDRVKVYPTENYYYFKFANNGIGYAGNIRLDASDRDAGKVHFAYFEDFAEWREEPRINYVVLDEAAGMTVEKLERFLYRVSYRGKAVLFELNDLSQVVPPATAIGPEETYIGPIFDDSAIRFFLLFNTRLKIFHYVLDETAKVAEDFLTARATDRILIGKRSGFAFYRDHKRERKILIGVFEANAAVNNPFDGPFDQLPDNFIEGDALQRALIEHDPSLAGKIDRFGHLADGSGRFLIGPYVYYRSEAELLPFNACATNPRIPAADYTACFSMDWGEPREIVAIKRLNDRLANANKSRKHARRKHAH
jgi:hypothetical protein